MDTLLFLAGEHGPEFDVYRSELEARANIKPSTQRAAEAKLEALQLLEVRENRLGYARNVANSYRLKGALLDAAKSMATRKRVGAKFKHPFGGVENLHPDTSPTLDVAKQPLGQRPPAARRATTSPLSGEVCMMLARTEQAKPSPSASAPPSQAEISSAAEISEGQALDLARSFLPQLLPGESLPQSASELMTLADRLRRIFAPTVWEPVWRSWRKRHGLTAALAVIETGVMRLGGQIRESGGQYLAGILGRNRRSAPAPELTLQAIRAARRSPGLTSTRRRPRTVRLGRGRE